MTKVENDLPKQITPMPKLLWRAFFAGVVGALLIFAFFYMHYTNALGMSEGITANVIGFMIIGALVFYLVRQDIVRFYSGEAKDASVRIILRFLVFGIGLFSGASVLGFSIGFLGGLLA